MKASLLDELARRPLLCDGAMGTQLFAAGLAPGACGEVWNAQNAKAVEAIHARYRSAGCDLVTTNTFGGTSIALERHGLAARADELNRAGAAAARRAVGDGAWVLGDVGPLGAFLEPLGEVTPEAATEMFAAQVRALRAGGADAVVVETMSDATEMAVAVTAARAAGACPVIATYAFGKGDRSEAFRTMMGVGVDAALGAAVDAGADVVGANCGISLGLDDYRRLADALVKAARGRWVILQPNAGSPETVGGKLVYGATPAAMAEMVPAMLACGVRIVGGCCGTTPEHLAAMAARMVMK